MSDDRLDHLDYYTLLGLEPDADVGAVRRAFRAFAVKYHPDRFASDAPENVERATAIYRRGSEALEVLSDPVARRAYDVGLARGELRLLDDPETAMRRQAMAARAAAAPPAAAPSVPPQAPQAHRDVRSVAPAAPAARPAAGGGLASLRTPQARAFMERARAAEASGDLRAAWRAAKAALELEPSSAWLESEFHRIGGRLR